MGKRILPIFKLADENLFLVLCVFQPWMLQHLVHGFSLLWLLLQALVHKVTKVSRPLLAVDLGGGVVSDVVENSDLGLADVGRLALGQFNHENAERPHVHLVVVLHLAANHFRRHPADSAHF